MTAEPFLWWRDGVIYQIYPRSFASSSGSGVGDLQGIRSKLPYLQDLGVDAIWLSPIYPSPNVDFGYDVSDYVDIHPDFGTLADFDALTADAHARGIRIVLDLVLNHTSDQHPWFQQARQGRDSPYRDYYLWRDPRPGGGPPNNWQAVFGGSAWEWDEASGQYYYHMFYKQQPDVNWRNPAVRQAMLDVFRFWLERGVDGFRLDVFNLYFKHADLPDNPPKLGLRGYDRQEHIYDNNQPEMMGLLEEIRALLDQYPERYMVGETFDSPAEMAAQYCAPGRLHAAFNFKMLTQGWRPGGYLRAVQEWEHVLAPESWPNYVLNNHDTRRSASRFGRGENDERLKVAAAMLLSLRGTPFLYYGEEIGMRDISLRRSEILDPIGKRYWPFHKGRDGCRAPMQWDAGENAGFGAGQPWLPPHPDYTFRNAAAQAEDPDSLLNFYKRLLALRREHAALRQGLFQPLSYEPRAVLGYLRQTQTETLLVALNFRRWPARLVLGGRLAGKRWRLLLSNKRSEAPVPQDGVIALAGEEALILKML